MASMAYASVRDTRCVSIDKGDPYGADRFSHGPAGHPDHRDHRDRSHVRSILFLPRVVRPGRRQALSASSEGIKYRLVQKPAQATFHPPKSPWEDVHHERHTDHRRGAGWRGGEEVPRQVRREDSEYP